jgi:hypothetical protein
MWWHTVTHGRGSEGGNWRMEWVASTLLTTSEHGVSSITTADAHTSAASSRLNWRPRRCKWTRPFRRKTKSGFCACAITFQRASTSASHSRDLKYFPLWEEGNPFRMNPQQILVFCTFWRTSGRDVWLEPCLRHWYLCKFRWWWLSIF